MPYKDLEKQREYQRKYFQKNKYNPQKRKERLENLKEWKHNNKTKVCEALKKYKKKNYKIIKINEWVKFGICEDFLDEIFEIYINTFECDFCKKAIDGKNRHLDHDHKTGEVRNILCMYCNIMRRD